MAPIVASKLQRKTIDRCGALLSCKSWLRGAISHDFHGFLPRNFNFFSAGAEQCLETWERKNGCMSLGSPIRVFKGVISCTKMHFLARYYFIS